MLSVYAQRLTGSGIRLNLSHGIGTKQKINWKKLLNGMHMRGPRNSLPEAVREVFVEKVGLRFKPGVRVKPGFHYPS